MNILFLSYDGLTEGLGQSQVIPYVQRCSANGHRYTIVSFEKKQFNGRLPDVEQQLSNDHIGWKPLKYHSGIPVVSGFSNLYRLWRTTDSIVRNGSFELIHSRSYFVSVVAFAVKRKYGVKVLFDMRGFWADERVEGKIWNLNNPIFKSIYHYLKRKEKEWLNAADGVVTLTHRAAEEIIHLSGNHHLPEKTTVIPCCADEDRFSPHKYAKDKDLELRKKLGLGASDRLLGYVGSLGTWYLGKEMMLQFKQLVEDDRIDKFLFITGTNESYLTNLAKSCGVRADRLIIKQVPHHEVPGYLHLMDVGICYILPTYSKMASSPTKLAEFLLMGKPVIANSRVGDMDAYFGNHSAGICHDVSKPDVFRISDEAWNTMMTLSSEEIRNAAVSEFSLKKGSTAFLEAYAKIK